MGDAAFQTFDHKKQERRKGWRMVFLSDWLDELQRQRQAGKQATDKQQIEHPHTKRSSGPVSRHVRDERRLAQHFRPGLERIRKESQVVVAESEEVDSSHQPVRGKKKDKKNQKRQRREAARLERARRENRREARDLHGREPRKNKRDPAGDGDEE